MVENSKNLLTVLDTGDGSQTLYRRDMDETYHSRHGAERESMHVFIQNGLEVLTQNPVNVLEIGFGTGLNALLTATHAINNNRMVHYTAIDNNYLPLYMASILKFPTISESQSARDLYESIHAAPVNTEYAISPLFTILKTECDATQWHPPRIYHLVYFDAFGPDKQPEMWTTDVFRRIFAAMNPGGILVTYSAKGEVRRTLQGVGFVVERLNGPPGKKHMTKAEKPK